MEPEEEFSVFDFVQYTKQKIDEILSKGKLPIVVGGTGLYIKAITEGYDFAGVPKNEELRKKFERFAEEKGNDYLFEMLQKKNPKMAENLDKFNTVRLVRALEIAFSNGEKGRQEVDIDPLLIALNRDRQKLYNAINNRVDLMFKNGLIKEVRALKERGLTKQTPCMKAIGYKEVLDFLDGEMNLYQTIEKVKKNSRNYAKRQLTFLRGLKNVYFVDVDKVGVAQQEIFSLVGDFLK